MSAQGRGGNPPSSEGLQSLLEYLKANRGFDFTGYKRSSLERRIRKRMQAVEVDTYGDYEDYLQVHPDEFKELFDTILINVTGFFRDRQAWEFLASDAIPRLLELTPPDRPIRVWSAACASGEEAYTAAIVLAEAMGEEDFRSRVKIYATDVDEDALTTARHAIYPRQALKDMPEEYVGKYFEAGPAGLAFKPELRRQLIFGRNDLVQDAPISRVDLLVSRNSLMYFTPETQSRILSNFNFSLRETGFLFLGKSEMLITHADLFRPYNLKWRVFQKVPRTALRDRLVLPGNAYRVETETAPERYSALRDAVADVSPLPQIAVDQSGFLAWANQPARTAFGLVPADIGRPIQDLEISYRPVELRAAIDQAREARRPVSLGRVEWRTGPEDQRVFEIDVSPVFAAGSSETLGVTVTFVDVTAIARLDEQHRTVQRELETAYEELQSTVEELETTNEELQSTNEELETTNEELQSTNEELETMNEELQSTNDELEAMNELQAERATELDRLNLFLEGILGSLGLAVIVLDSEQRVQLWNDSASEFWGLRDHEVLGQAFSSLDIGLPVHALERLVRQALGDDSRPGELTVEAVNRRGRHVHVHVRTMPLSDTDDGKSQGVIVLMSEAPQPKS